MDETSRPQPLGEALHLVDPLDDVAVALRDLSAGETAGALVIADDIPRGHKVALRAIAAGAQIVKYGWPIGRATADIAPGRHVHVHNVATNLAGEDAYAFDSAPPVAPAPRRAEPGFMGYVRSDGRVATRNEIWVLCTVGCVARTAQRIADAADRRFKGRIDGVVALTHPLGCSQLGDDLDHTRAVLAGLAGHPNAGGVLVVGLGCENNALDRLVADIPRRDPARLRAFNAQMVDDELEAGLKAVEALVEIIEHDQRQPRPLGDLVIGLKCGGSDGFSGLTANPLVGRMADRVTGAGGSAVLTEVPEIFGAERILMARAANRTVFDATVAVVNDFKRYFLDHGQPVSENPSPGNLKGGVTTLEEKSLGAVQKAGRAPLSDVIRYGAQVRAKGLTLLEAPGNDAVSSTALTAAGATIILFTTGRGTPLGFPVPTLKIATNSALARHKPRWIDFDAGQVLTDGMEAASDALSALIAATASGAPTKSEQNGEREIAIWKTGVTL